MRRTGKLLHLHPKHLFLLSRSHTFGRPAAIAALAGNKLVVVLGHSACGAIQGAINDFQQGSLTGVPQQIRPALTQLGYKGVPSSKDKALVQRVAERNAKDAAAQLVSRSPTMATLVKQGLLKIVHAMHDVASGEMRWFA